MIPRILFYPTLSFNLLLSHFGKQDWMTRIDHTVILGALPFRWLVDKLVKVENVKGVVTLNEHYETKYFVYTEQEWAQRGIRQLRLETPDFISAPSLDNLKRGVDFILDFSAKAPAAGSVYVHCKAGRTRSTTVVACYLMMVHRWNPKESVKFIRDKRPQIVLRKKQWTALEEFYDKYVRI